MTKLWISAGIELQKGADLMETKSALDKLVKETVKEPGCLKFEALQHQDNPQCFTLWECWTSDDALKAHFEAPHTLDFLSHDYTKVNYIERLQMNEAA